MKQIFNDNWQFKKDGDWAPVELPHDWLIYDVNNLYETSVGCYKKNFDSSFLKKGQRAIIEFDGVYMDTSFYVNEKLVGEWKYGYTSFHFDITDFLNESGSNELLVKVNHQSPNSRWYSGAGIYRDVFLHIKNEVYFVIDGIYICPRKEKEGNWRVTVNAEVNNTNPPYEIRHNIFHAAGEQTCYDYIDDGSILVYRPKLWDIESPDCYILRSEIIVNGEVSDCIETRFGFREIKYTTDEGFFLNGRYVKMFGCCQHHDLGALGAAFNKDAARRQLQILRDMGANAIRTSHNPPASGLMELTDEMGFLVMSEFTDMWLRPKTPFDYARFFNEWVEKDAAAWIRRDRNCPSVIMWSIGNEIYDTHADLEDGANTMRRLINLVKEHDPNGNAPATFCTNYIPWENTQICADIIKLTGYNYADYLYDKHHKEHPDWIIYGGETCSSVYSRGVYHFPLSKPILADDDLQCSSLGNSSTSWGKSPEGCIIAHRDAKFTFGQFIWTGTDYIGEPTPYHTKNSYFGQADTAGFPKDSFYIFQSAWTDYRKKPMVHLLPYWDFSPGQPVDIRVCSNAPKVELFLNGKSLGEREIDHIKGDSIIANFQASYESGVLKAVAYNENGKIVAQMERCSFGDTVSLNLKHTRFGDLIFTEITAVDKDGNPVENACDRVKVSVTGGTILGMDNGDSTDYDQYKTDSRRLFNGKLLAIVRPLKNTEPQINAAIDSSDIPIRKIELSACPTSGNSGAEAGSFKVTANIFPENATYKDLYWRLTDSGGIDSPLGTLDISDDSKCAIINPKGDGEAYIRCCAKNSRDQISLISLFPFKFEGYGKPFLNPYQFVSGGLYNTSNAPMTVGIERGIATLEDEESHVGFADLDFGSYGSDEVSMWFFPLVNDPIPVEIWDGMPEDGGTLLCTAVYDKGSIWNTYQEITCKLPKRMTGIKTFCFVVRRKMHFKGFQFKVLEKALQKLYFAEYNQIYGDSFEINPPAVEKIGNNVAIIFDGMDFKEGVKNIEICRRSKQDKNSVNLIFKDETGTEIKNMLILPASGEYKSESLTLEAAFKGKGTLSFVFLPGCNIDLKSFRFY